MLVVVEIICLFLPSNPKKLTFVTLLLRWIYPRFIPAVASKPLLLLLLVATTPHIFAQKGLMIILGTKEGTSRLDTGIQCVSWLGRLPLLHHLFRNFPLFDVHVPNSRSILAFAIWIVGVMHLGPGYHQVFV
jgi:hypothetical protein